MDTQGGQAGPVCVRQTPQHIDLWFGSPPVTQPPTYRDPLTGTALWLEGEVLRGVRLKYGLLAVEYPVGRLQISPEDLK